MDRLYEDAADSYPMVDLDSDDNNGEDSSEDDLNIILHGTPEQKRRLRRISLGEGSSSEDEFEKEMGAELSAAMDKIRDAANLKSSSSKPRNTSAGDGVKAIAPAPSVHFEADSGSDEDDEDDVGSGDKPDAKQQASSKADDDNFYDPNMDREDERWVARQRNYRNVKPQSRKRKAGEDKKGDLDTDAVLNCPACMSLLCLDCQRHAIYKNQYRAMFVKNCSVNMEEKLTFPVKKNKQKKKKGTQPKSPLEDLEAVDDHHTPSTASETMLQPETMETETSSTTAFHPQIDSNPDEIFHPVKCSACTSDVGVYDSDEVYHFFNVLSSHA